MAYKTTRNKALRDITRLITATYHGKEWATPGGYFAIDYPIYEGYRVLKGQEVEPRQPLLDKIIDGAATDHALAAYEQPGEENTILRVDDTSQDALVNPLYVALFRAVYPDCKLYLATAGAYKDSPTFAPIQVKHRNKMVGVIMPLRS